MRFSHLFIVNKEDFSKEKQQKHEQHHEKISWVYYACLVLGLWLIAAPFTLGYKVPEAFWNDIICGFIVIVLSTLAIKPYKLWAQWGIIFLGLWLLFAPLVFEVKEGGAYLNDTLIATLLISFAIIISRQPGVKLYALPGPDVPSGWSYNPSSWTERVPVIFFAWVGFFVARYLGSYQLGFIDEAWDPFFGEGTRKVLTSDVSKSFPVSDGMLGAVSYVLDVLFGKAGGIHRWRTMPWVVIIFAILIVPLGAVSMTLVILQPVTVGYWCTLCLTSAFISLIMIPFTLDEALASIQLLLHEKKKGKRFWTVFWFGGTMEGGQTVGRKDPTDLFERTGKSMWRDLLIKPWNLYLTIPIGVWVMAAPAVMNFPKHIADNYHLVGALIVAFAIIAMSEVARVLRFINALFGVWIIISPWVFGATENSIIWMSVITGLVLIGLSFPKGIIEDKRGAYDQYIY